MLAPPLPPASATLPRGGRGGLGLSQLSDGLPAPPPSQICRAAQAAILPDAIPPRTQAMGAVSRMSLTILWLKK